MNETKVPLVPKRGLCFKKIKRNIATIVVIVDCNKNKGSVVLQHIVRKRTVENTTTIDLNNAIDKGELVLLSHAEARTAMSSYVEGGRRKIGKIEDLLKAENDIVNTYIQCRKLVDGSPE